MLYHDKPKTANNNEHKVLYAFYPHEKKGSREQEHSLRANAKLLLHTQVKVTVQCYMIFGFRALRNQENMKQMLTFYFINYKGGRPHLKGKSTLSNYDLEKEHPQTTALSLDATLCCIQHFCTNRKENRVSILGKIKNFRQSTMRHGVSCLNTIPGLLG